MKAQKIQTSHTCSLKIISIIKWFLGGLFFVKEYIEERVLAIAEYIIDTKKTVRSAAKEFNVSKSTVHKDMAERLPQLCKHSAKMVRKVMDVNKAERHIRGGNATKTKYLNGKVCE